MTIRIALLVLCALGASFAQSPAPAKARVLRPTSKQIIAEQAKRIAEIEARVKQLEADNAAVRESNAKLVASNKELAELFEGSMKDEGELLAISKKLYGEHLALSDRYNQLVRDYNLLALQASAFAEQVRTNNAQARAQRDAALIGLLGIMRQPAPPIYQPAPAWIPAPRREIRCTSNRIGDMVYTNCR